MMLSEEVILSDDGTLVFCAPYRAKFTIDESVPVDVAIQSLKSYEALLQRTRPLVSMYLGNVNIRSTEVFVKEIGEGSFVVDFIVKYVIGEENKQKAQEIYDSTVKDNAKVRTVVAIGVGAAITLGAQALYSSSSPDNSKKQPHIEAYNSVVINAAGDVNISAEQLKSYQDSLKDSKRLAQETAGALAPARLSQGSEVEIDGLPNLKMGAEFINAVPETYQPPTQKEKEEPYSNMELMIFASDQDRSETGWAGIVPELFTKRVKFILGDDVQPDALHGIKKIRADIVVKERFSKGKNRFEPYEVLIVTTH